ncbi:hypothetical protein EHF36_12845 [Kerstersia gyiorum]|uniref:hypothetical protein n=1 Tax=Kerstersia gyiorum TaxID=206506 RepID=UPI0010710CB7|nr:hypothetical protein [Kerstersia gyiorum]QBR41410.1 hypothetical protein EHF36_12845 [Kerstersia gyiorum]
MNRRLSVVGDGGLRQQGAAKTVVLICAVFIPCRFYSVPFLFRLTVFENKNALMRKHQGISVFGCGGRI